MRVKSVPRHRVVQNHSNAMSASGSLQNLTSTAGNKELDDKDAVCSATAITVPAYNGEQNVTNRIAKKELEDNDAAFNETANDSMTTNASGTSQTSLSCKLFADNESAGPSCCHCDKTHFEEGDIPISKTDNEDANNNNVEAIDLSIKVEPDNDYPPYTSTEPEDKFKDTFLYKIMTDPNFLENIQRSKQVKKHVCPFCKQEFVNDDQLMDHMEVKKDETNQIICCACKKTFAQKRYLRYHQRCHSDRSKFTCDICTRKYTRLDNLARHNAFHVNPDKFSCGSCEKTFARKDLLNKHQKCHENKYRFYCEECSKYLKGPLTLDNHKRVYHSDA